MFNCFTGNDGVAGVLTGATPDGRVDHGGNCSSDNRKPFRSWKRQWRRRALKVRLEGLPAQASSDAMAAAAPQMN